MNTKKYRKRAPKLTQKADRDRGNQNRRATEGKSNNIAAKRITLFPGFLINGFTSSTVQKVKVEDPKRKKTHLIADDLQTFLEQKGKHPRRSQRILKKTFGHQSTAAGSKTSSGTHCDILESTPPGISKPNGISFKSILKNNSKSLFKDISDRFSKVNIHNTEAVGEMKSAPNEEQRNVDENFDYTEAISNHLDPWKCFSENRFEDGALQEALDFLRIDFNRSFCRNLEKQINVTFRRNAVVECREKVRKEIEFVKMALDGKVDVDKAFAHDSIDNGSEVESKEGGGGPSTKFYPVPAQNWVYSTPPNQKIDAPQIEECQLHAGVLYHDNNKNQQNLYEMQPKLYIDFSKLRNTECVPIDDRFMRKVAQVQKTLPTTAPLNFQFRDYRGGAAHSGVPQTLFQQPWRDSAECGGSGAQLHGQQETFVNPNFVKILTRPTKPARKPIFANNNYLQNRVPTPQVQENAKQNFTELRDCSASTALDFTFVQEGSDFKMRQSQPTTSVQQNNKRRLSGEEFVIKRRNVFITEPNICANDKMFDFGSQVRDSDKMFDFGSQERNMFDFGKV